MTRKERLYERDLGRCRYCGCMLELWQATTDHVIPKKQRGSNKDENIVIACPRCNAVKSDRTVEEAGMRLWSIEEFESLAGVHVGYDIQGTIAPSQAVRGDGAQKADANQVLLVPIPSDDEGGGVHIIGDAQHPGAPVAYQEGAVPSPHVLPTAVVCPLPPHFFDSWPYDQQDITVNEFDILYRVYKNYQKARIMVEGHIRGRTQLGLDVHPSLVPAQTIYTNLEKQAKKDLSIVKDDPLWPAFECIKGIDFVLAAGIRGLLDPWAFANVQKAWKYAGWAVDGNGEAQRKRKGETAGFCVPLKTRLWQAADCTMRARDPTFRPLYDAMKEKAFADLPEKKGRKGHAHNRATRYVAKQIIKWLWCYAHEAPFSRPDLDLPEEWSIPMLD